MADLRQKALAVKERLLAVLGDNGQPVRVAKAPGRVNLIGEHTDYNDGFVLPMAVDREIIMAAQPREDDTVRLYSLDFDQETSFCLKNIEKSFTAPWSNYVRGVLYFLKQRNLPVRGMNAALSGDVPQGAGMSSSAALEVVTGYMARLLGEFPLDTVELVRICQQAENRFVGVNCGIMDQFISGLGKKDHALFLDCRSLEYELVPLPAESYKVVICNTAVKRGLVDSQYNERREQCERGVEILQKYLPGIKALRDVSPAEFEQYRDRLPDAVRRRCEHVVRENQRVLDSVAALKAGDIRRFGELMAASHASLRDLYEVSCPELDIMVEAAQAVEGVLGARMTGAGFGGCTVNLVENQAVEQFLATVPVVYEKRTGLKPEIYVCSAEDGAIEVDI